MRFPIHDANQTARAAAEAATADVKTAIADAKTAAADAKTAAADAKAAAAEMQTQSGGAGGGPARAPSSPGTIVIPTDGGNDIRIGVDGKGIHVSQDGGTVTVPIHDIVPRGLVQIAWSIPATLSILLFWWPIGRAIARSIDRRGAAANVSAGVQARLDAMERNIDTVALEMERVSEGQRFTNKLLTERQQEVVPVPVPVASAQGVR